MESSDLDFHDVFGGPPRRQSAIYNQRADSFDLASSASAYRRKLRAAADVTRTRWSELGEKPVFGGDTPAVVSSPARRIRPPHHLVDDFFDDIFPGSGGESSSSTTPRRVEKDGVFSFGFPSTPPSPAAPPRRSEQFLGGSGGTFSLPAQLSLSKRLDSATERSASSSPAQRTEYKHEILAHESFHSSLSPNNYVPDFVDYANVAENKQKKDNCGSYRQSPLSRSFMRDINTSEESAEHADHCAQSKSLKDLSSIQGYGSGRFHFSIYKWAGKGVTVIRPSDSKERVTKGHRSRRLPEVVLEVTDIPTDEDFLKTISAGSNVQKERLDSKLRKFPEDKMDEAISSIVEDVPQIKMGFNFLKGDGIEESARELKPQHILKGSSYEEHSCIDTIGEVSFTMREEYKTNLRNIRQLLDDEFDRPARGADATLHDYEMEDSTDNISTSYDGSYEKQEDISNNAEKIIPHMQEQQEIPTSMEEKLVGRRLKGKVRQFVKIFNQEVPLKTKGMNETQGKKTKRKDGKKSKGEAQGDADPVKTVEEVKASSIKDMPTRTERKIAEDQTLKKTKNPMANLDSEVAVVHDFSSWRHDNLHQFSTNLFFENQFSVPIAECVDVSVGNIEVSHYEELDDCVVEQLSDEQNELLQTTLHQDENQTSDNKIREWSKGKEGNIRALLSTLQFVLWPDRGWKPVRLVDIVEGGSVKKAYQKALLFLHPDKLQQKGASTQQKYIAERVFDILQVAWDHFSSVSSMQ